MKELEDLLPKIRSELEDLITEPGCGENRSASTILSDFDRLTVMPKGRVYVDMVVRICQDHRLDHEQTSEVLKALGL